MKRSVVALSCATVAIVTAGCGTSDGAATSSQATTAAGQLNVVTAVYPLEFALREIGGTHVAVRNLAKPGTHPHDLELTPKDVAAVSDASLIVYAKGFSSAIDTAARQQGKGTNTYDVSSDARLTLRTERPIIEEGHAADDGHNHESEADEHGGKDPHFWLDPTRYISVAQGIATRLSTADPAHRADYTKNAAAFVARLKTLDHTVTTSLRSCSVKDLVTSHAAFGYLAERASLTQVPIGLTPEQEPDPANLAKITAYAKRRNVTTIYTEPGTSPAAARTIARSVGVRTAELNPAESRPANGQDYFSVMAANVAAIKSGQGCS